jgi:L-cysteine:1D-myo-inositol 2-amino-2-deoxy-alpha-D-glucopyranoside ligase
MRAWPAPDLPRLPGEGLPLQVRDASAGTSVPAATGPTARMYVCGITPYDATHLGHANTYLAFDLIGRALHDAGVRVLYTQNVTDVDEPLLERAEATGESWWALAERETELFREDMTALRILPPTHYVGAVEAMPIIGALVSRLLARGAAYDVDGDLYFPVSADPTFGSVSRLSREEMTALFAERGGDPQRPGKKDPLDPLVWRHERDGEPAWGSQVGSGRPGWHVECAAIALDRLGNRIDIQGGGSDLAFPHHEMSAAHAHAATGLMPFARAYVHAGMVGLDGEKMSKSRGNLVFVSALRRDGAEPAAIRLALLAHRYSTDWEWSPNDLATATERLARWRSAVSRPDGPPAQETLDEVRARLADDLDAPGALAAVDAWAERANGAGGTELAAPGIVSRAVDALLGVAL